MPTFDELGKKALDIMENTVCSLFLTGKAGTGKSTLIKHFLMTTQKNVLILAPTGVAAVNVGGVTIHSFFGVHPGITVEEAREGEYSISESKMNLLMNCDALVIDEISMVRADLMDVMNVILQDVFENKEPMGGKQLLMVGDLFQLPPIVRGQELQYFTEVYGSPYFFAPNRFPDLEVETIELRTIYRQDDLLFTSVLNKIRLGLQSKADLHYLNSRVGELPDRSKSVITLVTTNADADKINMENLSSLSTNLITSRAEIEGDVSPSLYMNDTLLSCKIGSQVMILVNGPGYHNGSIGVLIDFDPDKEEATIEIDGCEVKIGLYTRSIRKPIYNEETKKIHNEIVGSFTQLPIKLAWAITIHKSQGLTFDRVVIHFGRRVFAKGQAYVALSRVRTFEGLYLKRAVRYSDILIDRSLRSYFNDQCLSAHHERIQIAIDASSCLSFIYITNTGVIVNKKVIPYEIKEYEFLGSFIPCFSGVDAVTNSECMFDLRRVFELTEDEI